MTPSTLATLSVPVKHFPADAQRHFTMKIRGVERQIQRCLLPPQSQLAITAQNGPIFPGDLHPFGQRVQYPLPVFDIEVYVDVDADADADANANGAPTIWPDSEGVGTRRRLWHHSVLTAAAPANTPSYSLEPANSPVISRTSFSDQTRTRRAIHASRTVVVLAIAFLSAATASGADFIVLEDECNGQQLLISGPIEPGDADRFAVQFNRLVTSPSLPGVQDPELLWTLKLDSSGGDLPEAMRLGRQVRESLITTEVSFRFEQRADGVYDFERKSDPVCLVGDDRLAGCSPSVAVADCTGACLLIWLAGVDRRAIEGRLGNHGLAAGGPAAAAYLRDMEIDPEWIARLLDENTVVADRSIGDGWLDWTGKGELSGRAPALDSLLADCPAPLSPAQAIESVMTPSPEHRASLLDRNEAYWNCRNARIDRARATTARHSPTQTGTT